MLTADSKRGWQPPWPVLAVALSLLGLGAWVVRKQSRSPLVAPVPVTSFEPLTISKSPLPRGGEEPSGHESLEDALQALESGAPDMPDPGGADGFFSSLPGEVEVVEAHRGSSPKPAKVASKATKAPKASRTVAPPSPKEEVKEPRTAAKKSAKSGRRPAKDAKADDALAKLEETDDTKKAKAIVSDFVQKMLSSDSKTADEVVESALKNSRSKAAAPKVSAEDKKKAQAIIRDTLSKLEASGEADSSEGGELRQQLQALLGGAAGDGDGAAEDDGASADGEGGAVAKKRRKGAAKKTKKVPELEPEADADEDSHMDFVKLLREESERKHEHSVAGVKKEFKREFASDARQLLCSGCKLVAARLSSELSTHDVHEQDSPAQMLAAKRRAIDATCTSFRHLHVVSGESGLRFEAGEAQEGSPGQAGASQRLCTALLEESRFELLSKLIRRKVPETSHLHAPDNTGNNWERWLCAQRARLCKRSEVQEDEDEESQEL